ncbi:MAG TPA: MBL fold metallo-hydrolase [Methanothermococcus okinawensis]|uniref:MBL fold metallo-hydrolase n=1 Tax=Methanothermococcus okinawensis TaxID=155863 RepID=A0A832ZK47_9EURY|nr:MBL fold metallo-hydrolase [Methanococcaceae archaeon]HIP84103.1 MBL fold metallo-hydrolase [Methanothermococcus okinawensis]HIP91649.1 MBL fold metallo-hydrolase [Methanothermococcus okinawensis]
MLVDIIFLGAGGGRWETIYQNKGTGGFRIHTEKTRLHIDPGPGTLVRMRELKINPLDTNILFVSHDHPDHYTDAEVVVEAMTRGMTEKRGHIVSNISVLEGFGKYENAISKYHQSMCQGVHMLNPGETVSIYDVTLTGTRTKHGDPFGIGLRVSTYRGDIGYTGDTEKIDSLSQDFDGVRILVANVMRERGRRIRGHLCSDDVIDLLESMDKKPELVIMNHMGLKMTNTIGECKYILEHTGVKTIAAKIGLKISLYKDFYSIVYL